MFTPSLVHMLPRLRSRLPKVQRVQEPVSCCMSFCGASLKQEARLQGEELLDDEKRLEHRYGEVVRQRWMLQSAWWTRERYALSAPSVSLYPMAGT